MGEMNGAMAQNLNHLIDQRSYEMRVKLVDEFFDRFNGEKYRPDVADSDSACRERNLLLLFDRNLFHSFEDSAFIEAKAMVDTVISHNVKIHYADTSWFAKALCKATFKGKSVYVTLYLKTEKRKEDMYKWVIVGAVGDILRLNPSINSDKQMLMPDDHETNFLSLHRITRQKDDCIISYAEKCFEINQTSSFYAFVYGGLLDIDYVEELEFVFYQVPDYVFSIKYFERNEYNSGWLISSFRRLLK